MIFKFYYKTIENGNLFLFGCNNKPKGIDESQYITYEEYLELQTAFEERQKKIAEYVKKVKAGEMTLEEVPEEYRAEVEAIINIPEPVDPKQALIDEIIAEVNA